MAGFFKPQSGKPFILVSKIKFDDYDTDQSGYLDLQELKAVLYDLGMRTSETDLVGALLALDKAKDGRVSYDEFKEWYREREKRVDALTLTEDSQRVLSQAIQFFKDHDTDMSGEIDRHEFELMYRDLRDKWRIVSNEFSTFDELYGSFDRNRDEKVSLEEFVQWLVDAGSIRVSTEAD
ncbi:uncharacterized protein LOC134183539 [Corticium candelabrum]|uniref:uncharacterized protein LOC134183539 n=1 Tax=Corticium candelabrum TaxID=121492 RepID=UPI002E25A039|nr:uncharacterized protein LOC134183539 [Corticium candelabrum]